MLPAPFGSWKERSKSERALKNTAYVRDMRKSKTLSEMHRGGVEISIKS
jgi:hypothetical protein